MEGQLNISNDKSPLNVIRVKIKKAYWYYIPDEQVYINSSGNVIPGLPPQSGGEDGSVTDDIAVGFRILIQMHKLTQFILSQLPDKLFIEEKDSNAKKTEKSRS